MSHSVTLPSRKKKYALLETELKAVHISSVMTAQSILLDSADEARELIKVSIEEVSKVHAEKRRKQVDCWNQNNMLVKWFGKVKRPRHVRKVYQRMKSVQNRLDKGITIRLRPNDGSTANAFNGGTFFSARGFKAYPNIFWDPNAKASRSHAQIGAIFIHELIHLWFFDQQLNGSTVYDEQQALDLAKQQPRSARKSAENYERFALAITGN